VTVDDARVLPFFLFNGLRRRSTALIGEAWM
jgi:hypothetical protein